MKKTFQAAINGRVYNIEEDAYNLLQNYLTELRAAFRSEEGEEIVSDIESRISEHFDVMVNAEGRMVVNIDDINRVITIMGRPEELQEESGEVTGTQAGIPAGNGSVPPPPADGIVPPAMAEASFHRKLFRDVRHKVFGGVLAGLGQYLGWDVTILRILVVIATVAIGGLGGSFFWAAIFCYMVAWMVIPPADTPLRILEMRGQPVTVDTVGQTVIDTSVPPQVPLPHEGNGFTRTLNSILGALGRVVLIFVGGIAAIGACVMVILALIAIAGIIGATCMGNYVILEMFDGPFGPYNSMAGAWSLLLLFFAIMLPLVCLSWLGLASLFSSAPKMSTTMAISLVIIEILLVVGCSITGLIS